MPKPFRVLVFGKPGCDKCELLNKRLDSFLAGEEWHDFEKKYCDLETAEGLLQFAESECINPQQIPAMLVSRRDEESGYYEPMPNPRPGDVDEVCGRSKLYYHLGLRTDYSETGQGVLSPEMISAVLQEARGG